MMTTQERIYSRERAYSLLGDVFLHGVSTSNAAEMNDVPVLSEYIAHPIDEDQWAAEYQRIFGFNVPPYASVFLEDDGYLGGVISDAVGRMYRRAGFLMNDEGMMPDHIGDELQFLAYLNKRHRHALIHHRKDETAHIEALAGSTLNHLLDWLPLFAETLRHLSNEFYSALASLALELVVDHAGNLGQPAATFEKAGRDAPIEELRDLARFLIRPGRCGFYLGRDQIVGIGRRIDVPTGFIDREQMMLNVLEAARRYEAMPALFDVLSEHIESCRVFYEAMLPEPYSDQFGGQLDRSKQVLRRLPY